MSDLKLTAMLCSRLCHDLVGPIGAIGNGIEILEDENDPDMREQALGLLARSAKQATGRLRFYRLAFGAAGGDELTVSVAEARRVSEDMFADEKANLIWPEADGGDPELTKMGLRLLLNLLLVGAACLIRGGDVTVSVTGEGGGWSARLDAVGQTVRLDDEVREILAGNRDLDDIEARMVQPYYAAALAGALDSAIELAEPADGHLELRAKLG